jgi:hypothetical protein
MTSSGVHTSQSYNQSQCEASYRVLPIKLTPSVVITRYRSKVDMPCSEVYGRAVIQCFMRKSPIPLVGKRAPPTRFFDMNPLLSRIRSLSAGLEVLYSSDKKIPSSSWISRFWLSHHWRSSRQVALWSIKVSVLFSKRHMTLRLKTF